MKANIHWKAFKKLKNGVEGERDRQALKKWMHIKSHIETAVKETVMSKACLFCFIGIFAQLPARKTEQKCLHCKKLQWCRDSTIIKYSFKNYLARQLCAFLKGQIFNSFLSSYVNIFFFFWFQIMCMKMGGGTGNGFLF